MVKPFTDFNIRYNHTDTVKTWSIALLQRKITKSNTVQHSLGAIQEPVEINSGSSLLKFRISNGGEFVETLLHHEQNFEQPIRCLTHLLLKLDSVLTTPEPILDFFSAFSLSSTVTVWDKSVRICHWQYRSLADTGTISSL